jgi:hypothetical protein
MQRFYEQGSWPKIRELFQTGVTHRFMIIPPEDQDNWKRPAAGRHVHKNDPRFTWGMLIYEAYHDNKAFPIEEYHLRYPTNLRAEMRDEAAMIQAHSAEATQESIDESNREQLIREELETHEDLLQPPDFIREIQQRKDHLLRVIREDTPEKISYEIREHIRRMSHLWESMTTDQKAMYEQWHATNIKEPGLKTKLIDIIASLEARKIPIKHFGCPICRENGDDYHASSPKTFQNHCKRLHGCSYLEARDATVFTLNQITGNEIVMKTFWGSGEQRLMRWVIPICYMPMCPHSGINNGTSLTKHMHDHHPATHVADLGFWGVMTAWIKTIMVADATIEHLLGKHTVHVCSGEQCGFGAVTSHGVKNHLHVHKSGRATAIKAELRPDIVVGIKGDCSD